MSVGNMSAEANAACERIAMYLYTTNTCASYSKGKIVGCQVLARCVFTYM